jgi:FkbM family methyltransferase
MPPEVRLALPAHPKIMDLGANVGLFGVFAFCELPGCQIVGYEPDPANARVLQLTLASELSLNRYRLVLAAAGTQDGEARFALGLADSSRQSEDGVPVPIRDVMPEMAGADLVKMDIEGGEWPLLGDPRLRDGGPRVFVLEYHRDGCPSPNPDALVRSLLEDAGYSILPPVAGGAPHEAGTACGTLWAVRRDAA